MIHVPQPPQADQTLDLAGDAFIPVVYNRKLNSTYGFILDASLWVFFTQV